MRIRSNPGLTFDDVLLIPRHSHATSRGDVSTSTRLTPSINMAIPIVSANMDTVTEWQMAVAMARAGGIGIIHRFMTAEREAEEVRRAKRAESHIVESPQTLSPDATAREAREMMARRGVGGFVVVDAEHRPVGIVTRRDLQFAASGQAVSEVMTPAERMITASTSISMEDAHRLLLAHRIEKLPLVDADGRLAGLITTKDISRLQQYPLATKDGKGRLRVGGDVFDREDALGRQGEGNAELLGRHGRVHLAVGVLLNIREKAD